MKKKFTITVTQEVEVTLDLAKFDETFIREYAQAIHPLHTVEDHAKFLASMCVRGFVSESDPEAFIEGYGRKSEMGIATKFVRGSLQLGTVKAEFVAAGVKI